MPAPSSGLPSGLAPSGGRVVLQAAAIGFVLAGVGYRLAAARRRDARAAAVLAELERQCAIVRGLLADLPAPLLADLLAPDPSPGSARDASRGSPSDATTSASPARWPGAPRGIRAHPYATPG